MPSIAIDLSEPTLDLLSLVQTIIVVGTSQDSQGAWHATKWTVTSILGVLKAITLQDLGVLPGGGTSEAWAISGTGGLITGYSQTGSGFDAFLIIQNGAMQDISPGSPFSGNSFAYNINRQASTSNYAIVGEAETTDSCGSAVYQAFLLTQP
ncbi:hypothetical protein ACLBXI_25405 [Bacillus cereus]